MSELTNKYSIVLPVRNGGEYLKELVTSIFNQSLSSWNLHVLDNCSSDGSVEWLRSLNDPRILISLSDKSLSIEENWSRIKDLPKNEYMTMIGHDDLLHPNYLAEMDKLIGQYPDAGLWQTHFNYIDAAGKLIRKCQPMDEVQQVDGFVKTQMLKTIDSTGTGYMMRSKDYDRLGGIPCLYPDLIYADYELWVRLTSLAYKATSPVFCFSYRIHNSTSKLTSGEKYQAAFEKYIRFLTDFKIHKAKLEAVVNEFGKKFLLDNCEGLSHRILKTDPSRRNISVMSFVIKCKRLATLLIPHQSFHPLLKTRILIAVILDNPVGRRVFNLIKAGT